MQDPDRHAGRDEQLENQPINKVIDFLQTPPMNEEVLTSIQDIEDSLKERPGMHEWLSLWPKRQATISLSSLESAIRQVLVKAATERGWHAVVISHRYGGRVTTCSYGVPTYSRDEAQKKERSRLTVFARTGHGQKPAKGAVENAYHKDLTPELEEVRQAIKKAGRSQDFVIQRHEYDPRT